MTPSASSAMSLLDKYPHLRLLAARRKEDVAKHGAGSENHEVVGDGKDDVVSGRISLLGPGPGLGRRKSSEDGTANVVVPAIVPRTRVVAEELFAASVAADDDQWLQFQVEAAVPARQQLDQLKLWLVAVPSPGRPEWVGFLSSSRTRERRCWRPRPPGTVTRAKKPWRW